MNRPPGQGEAGTSLDPGAARRAIEHCYQQGWTDGLPVVPAAESSVAEFLGCGGRDADEVIGAMPHLNRECTVRLAAVNAVMAGCRPEHFPVVLAAWEALQASGYVSRGLLQSTTGAAPILVVNGDARERLGFNSGGNVFGPGSRANATVGRALRLIVMNAFGIRPHGLDQSTQSTPAKYTCCIAENEEENPWEPLSVSAGFAPGASTVAAAMMRSTLHVENRHATTAEQLLHDFADTLSRTGGLLAEDTSCFLVLGPEHARFLAANGLAKQDVQEFLVEHSGRGEATYDRVGKGAVDHHTRWRVPKEHGSEAPAVDWVGDGAGRRARILPSSDAVAVVVAGAGNAGVSTIVETFRMIPDGRFPAVVPIAEVRDAPPEAGADAGA